MKRHEADAPSARQCLDPAADGAQATEDTGSADQDMTTGDLNDSGWYSPNLSLGRDAANECAKEQIADFEDGLSILDTKTAPTSIGQNKTQESMVTRFPFPRSSFEFLSCLTFVANKPSLPTAPTGRVGAYICRFCSGDEIHPEEQ
jgi:hypothetical protein